VTASESSDAEILRRAQHQLARGNDVKKGIIVPITDEVVPVSALRLTDEMHGKRQMRFGFPMLDAIAPLFQTTMSVLGARTGVGKTSLARNVALRNARDGAKVFYASFEFTRARMMAEFMQEVMRMSKPAMFQEARDGTFAVRQAEREMESLEDRLLLWHPHDGAKMIEVFRRADKYEPDFLIIDYARAIEDWRGREAAERLSHELANFTKKRPIHTMLLQQLSREAAGIRPDVQHIADSDVLGQRADQIFVAWRPMEQRGSGVRDTIIEIIPVKNRFGPTYVRRHLHWTGEVQGIDGFSREEEDQIPDCCRSKKKASEAAAPKPILTLAADPEQVGLVPYSEEGWPTEEPIEESLGEPITFWEG
jgi:KaiC/GvpD/RAD55 family RecA-like ATPase